MGVQNPLLILYKLEGFKNFFGAKQKKVAKGGVRGNFKYFVNIKKIYAQMLKKCPLSSRGVKIFLFGVVLFYQKMSVI